MNFLKRHWFGLITGLFIFCVLVLFVLVLLSPRQDAKKRGFIPCTEAMAERMLACPENGKTLCMLKAVLGNSWVRRQSCRRRCQSMGERQAASSVE